MLRTAAKLIVEDGCGVVEACARLNALGLKPRRASRWDRQNLRLALRQDYLKGEFLFGRPGRWGNHGHPIPMDVPAVLDRRTFDSLQAALGATLHHRGPTRKLRVYPLTGRLYSTCGQKFIGTYRKDRGGGRREYLCWGARHERGHVRCVDTVRLKADDIEALVWDEVSAILGEPDRLMSLARDYLGLRGQQMGVEKDQLAVAES